MAWLTRHRMGRVTRMSTTTPVIPIATCSLRIRVACARAPGGPRSAGVAARLQVARLSVLPAASPVGRPAQQWGRSQRHGELGTVGSRDGQWALRASPELQGPQEGGGGMPPGRSSGPNGVGATEAHVVGDDAVEENRLLAHQSPPGAPVRPTAA